MGMSIMDQLTELQLKVNELQIQVDTLSQKFIAKFGDLTVLTDFNIALKPGRYIFYKTTLNNPRTADGVMEIFSNQENLNEITQFIIYYNDNNVLSGVRHSDSLGSLWSDWMFSPTTISNEMLWLGANKTVTDQAPVDSIGKDGDFWVQYT